jgi:uncharacterized phage-associated protein
MAVSAASAAKTICVLRDWSVSNLELQKILYLAHMFHMGVHDGAPLIREPFEAWNYGPVVPELYQRMKPFGSDPVQNVFHWIEMVPMGIPEFKSLNDAIEGTKNLRASQLVANTHSSDGAWAKVYRPNIAGIRIPNAAILNEYRARANKHAIQG